MNDYFKRRLKHGKRCAWLDLDGERCKRRATIGGSFHGDPETTNGWVYVELCEQHAVEGFLLSIKEIAELKTV